MRKLLSKVPSVKRIPSKPVRLKEKEISFILKKLGSSQNSFTMSQAFQRMSKTKKKQTLIFKQNLIRQVISQPKEAPLLDTTSHTKNNLKIKPIV